MGSSDKGSAEKARRAAATGRFRMITSLLTGETKVTGADGKTVGIFGPRGQSGSAHRRSTA